MPSLACQAFPWLSLTRRNRPHLAAPNTTSTGLPWLELQAVHAELPVTLRAPLADAAGETADAAALTPNYLRLSQAERERLEREKNQ